jgi:hypothetical protein
MSQPNRVTVPLTPRAFKVLEGLAKISRRSMGREAALHLEGAILEKPRGTTLRKGARI